MVTPADHDKSEHPVLDEPRPGQELRVARERAGISRDSMAERLRLAVEQFDALENDDYAELPPPAFVRGYFRAYARELGLDPDEYIAAYNRSGVSARDPEIRTGGGVADTSPGGRGGLIGLLLIALVAAGGIGAWWYQQGAIDGGGDSGAGDSVEQERSATDTDPDGERGAADSADGAKGVTDTHDNATATDGGNDGAGSGGGNTDAASAADDDAADEQTASVDVEAAEATAATTQDEGNAREADAGDSADDGEAADDEGEESVAAKIDREALESATDEATSDAAGESRTDADAESDAVAAGEDDASGSTPNSEPGSTSPAATDSPTRAATEAAGSGPDEITLEFSSRSWLEVYDDRERELVYTLYFGSEPITLEGWAPFEIFLGNSPAVEVRFNGERIDKSDFTRSNNTARFVVDASGVRAP